MPNVESGNRSENGLHLRWGARYVVWLTLIAFALRVFDLATQSLSGDEAFSVFRAFESLGEITAAVPREITLPPLYYYFLHFWILLVGHTEFGVRFLSVLFGVVAIPLVYLLARRTIDERTGVIAAGIATFSPFWIYYSQETRTYAQVNAFLFLALYLLFKATIDERWQRSFWGWSAYSIAAALAIASYYFAGFALAAGVTWALAYNWRRPRVAGRCVLAQVVVVGLLTPLLIFTYAALVAMTGSITRAGIPLRTIVDHLIVVFNVGTTIDASKVLPFVVVSLALGALGAITMPRAAAMLWGATLVIPILAIFVVSFVPQPGWARYFMTASVAWYVVVAAGLNALLRLGSRRDGLPPVAPSPPRWSTARVLLVAGRLAFVLASVALIRGAGESLGNYYFNPAYWRYDLRSAVRRVESAPASAVAAIVNGPEHYPSFFYYYQGKVPAVELPAPKSTTSQEVSELSRLVTSFRGLWFVKYRPPDYDPDARVEIWLDEHAYAASLDWTENVTYSFYVTENPAAPDIIASSPVGVAFGTAAQLISYRVARASAQGGDYLLVSVMWRPLRTPSEDLQVFAHLLDSNETRLAQSDHALVQGIRPSRTWRAGEIIDDRFALKLPVDPQDRGLRLEVGMDDPTGARLSVDGAASPRSSVWLPLPGLSSLVARYPLNDRLGSAVRLLGYDLPSARLHPGDTVQLTLYWQPQSRIDQEFTVFTHLLAAGTRLAAQQDSPPLGGRRPTSTWLPGEVLADRYQIAIPTDAQPGHYVLEVGMYDSTTGQRLSVTEGDPRTDGESRPAPSPSADRVLIPNGIDIDPVSLR